MRTTCGRTVPFRRAAGADPPAYGTCDAGRECGQDTSTMILRLNDIVRGEYVGRAVYKRNELVENTDTDESASSSCSRGCQESAPHHRVQRRVL